MAGKPLEPERPKNRPKHFRQIPGRPVYRPDVETLWRGGRLCRVAGNTVWSHWHVNSRSSEMGFINCYTCYYYYYYTLGGIYYGLCFVSATYSFYLTSHLIFPSNRIYSNRIYIWLTSSTIYTLIRRPYLVPGSPGYRSRNLWAARVQRVKD